MFKKNYEKTNELIIITVIFILLVILFIIYLVLSKIPNNILLNGVVNSKNTIELLVDDKELKVLYQNKVCLIDDTKIKYEIRKVTLKVIKKDNIYYHDIIIKAKFNNKYKENDSLKITLKKNKISLIKIFELIWKGD